MDDFERVRNAVDLFEVVTRHVPLKTRGARMVGLCPFHLDTNPSFGIPHGQQYYKCFCCNKGGDVITFVSEIEHIDRFEALRRLAKAAGIRLLGDEPREREEGES